MGYLHVAPVYQVCVSFTSLRLFASPLFLSFILVEQGPSADTHILTSVRCAGTDLSWNLLLALLNLHPLLLGETALEVWETCVNLLPARKLMTSLPEFAPFWRITAGDYEFEAIDLSGWLVQSRVRCGGVLLSG